MAVTDDRRAEIQLGLPGVAAPRSALICTTLSALALYEPSAHLRSLGARVVVDLRIAPSFGRLNLVRRQFVELLEQLGAGYVHLLDLSNRHAGDTSHEELHRRQLMAQFDEHRAQLQRLREMIDDGPVMLIVARRASTHLDVLLESLERLEPGFEIHMQMGS